MHLSPIKEGYFWICRKKEVAIFGGLKFENEWKAWINWQCFVSF
jgi:hypothetical protein